MTSDTDSHPVQRLEVVNTGRRRRWTLAEKLRIVEESFQGERQVSATARRHGIPPSLLFSWRKRFRGDGGEAAKLSNDHRPEKVYPLAWFTGWLQSEYATTV